MTTTEGVGSSSDAQPPLKVTSSAAICCVARIQDNGQVEILVFTSQSRGKTWTATSRVQLPSESGKTAHDLGSDSPEDPASIVTRCFKTEVLLKDVCPDEYFGPIDNDATSIESRSSRLTPLVSWCVRADTRPNSEPSLHRKDIFAFLGLAGLDSVLRKTVIVDTDRGTGRSEKLESPRWAEARNLIGQMQSMHGPVAHAVAVLQVLRLLSRLDTSDRVRRQYESLLSQREFKPLVGEPDTVAQYLTTRKAKTVPQPNHSRKV